MTDHSIQISLIENIKDKLGPNVSFVDDLAELLDISNDSAYRRIRGDKSFSVDELKKVCLHYNISFDQILGQQSTNISFTPVNVGIEPKSILNYLQHIRDDLVNVETFADKEVQYLAKDIPAMQLFQFPAISAFKMFFWQKTIAANPHFENLKFKLEEGSPEVVQLSKEILDTYIKVPSTEIWSEETVISLVTQIKYYSESGWFEDPAEVDYLFDQVIALLDHMDAQAAAECKFKDGQKPIQKAGNFKLYINDLVLPNNTICVRTNDEWMVYISHNVMNFLKSYNKHFGFTTHSTITNLIKRSTLISGVGERERNKFFSKLKKRVLDTKASL